MAENRQEPSNNPSEKEELKTTNLLELAKEDIAGVMHGGKSPHHHKETHGTSDDIDENTPADEVKGPSVFQRAKEEMEALVETLHPKKDKS